MKLILVSISACMMLTVACDTKEFSSKSGSRSSKKVTDNQGPTIPVDSPLDISNIGGKGGSNGSGTDPDTTPPTGGPGEKTSETIELGCEESQGAIVDVYPEGEKPSTNDDGKTTTVNLLGDSTVLDEDGNPKDSSKGGGKDPGPTAPDTPKGDDIVTDDDAKTVAVVKGRFCPQSKKAKHKILFIVDYSGSMGPHRTKEGLKRPYGNDPIIAGTCGRLEAAQKIIEALDGHENVEVGMIPFASKIVTGSVINMIDLNTFKDSVNTETFCNYIPFGNRDAGTNYHAAFTAAQTKLTGTYGMKTVYFISDGEPTVGPPWQEAARSFRETSDNLTLNALLLGNLGDDSKDTLIEVAGHEDRVREAENAEELAAKITSFPDVSIDNTSAVANLFVDPYGENPLDLKTFDLDPNIANQWYWETQPFILLGNVGETTENIVTVNAKGMNGEIFEAKVVIRYKR